MDYKHLGERIMLTRRRMGWTQKKLAETAGVTQQLLSQIEHGHRPRPAFETIYLIAKALSVPIDDLVGDFITVEGLAP